MAVGVDSHQTLVVLRVIMEAADQGIQNAFTNGLEGEQLIGSEHLLHEVSAHSAPVGAVGGGVNVAEVASEEGAGG